MDEKYIQHIYNSLGGQAKFGKYEDFRDLISNNEDYRKQFHSTFGEKQLGAYNDFNDLVSVKKKDTGTSLSQSGTLAGNMGSEIQSTKNQNEQGINQDDPIGSYQDMFIKQHDNLSQQLRQQQTPFAQDATAKRNVLPADASLNKVNNFLTTVGQLSENKKQFQSVRDDAKKYMDALPSSEAKKYVQERVQKDNPNAPDVLNINTEDIRNLPSFKGNVTANMMLDKVDNYKNVLKAGDGALNIEDWARNFAASNNPELYKVLSKPIPDNQQAHFSVNGQLPGTTQNNKKEKSIASGITYGKDAATGTSVYELLSNPAAQEISQSNPELHQQFQHAYDNLFQTYPSLGRKILGEQIGKYREENGRNNILYNSTDGNDKIVEELVNKGQLPPSSLQFYNANKSAIHVPTSDIVSNLFHGIDVGVKGGLSSISDVYTSGKQATKEATENKYTQQSFTPKGTLHELTTTIPEFTGQILPIALLSKGLGSAGVSPRIASAISMGTMFEHNNRQRGAELFPNNTGMQQLYSTISTGADMLIGAAYDRGKAISFLKKEVKPEISDVLKKLDGGEINEIAAKDAIKGTVNNAFDKIKNFGGEAIKQNVQQSAQIGGFTLAHDIVDAAFGQKLDLNKSLDKSLESAKNAFISGSALSLLAAAGQTNPAMKVAADQVYDMAKNYDKTRDAINNDTQLSDAEKEERVTNLDHAKLILNDVENNLDLTDKQKKRYLLQSLNEKVLQDKMDNTTDSVLKNKYKEQIKISQKARENIIGEKPVEKQVQNEPTPTLSSDQSILKDAVDNGEIKQGMDVSAKEAVKTADDSTQFLKDVAEQANNANNQSGLFTDEAALKRAKEVYGENVVNIAIKRFPKNEVTNPETNIENQQGNISTEEKKPTEQSVSENVQQPEKSDYDHFKEQMLSELENRSKDKFDLKINHELLPVEQKTIEQGIKNIREGRDTKAAQQVEAAIKKMYDDGVVHYEAKNGKIHTQQPQGIPASHFIDISKEASKPIDINNDDHLHELNMMLGEDAFPHVVNEENTNFKNQSDESTSKNDTGEGTIQQPTKGQAAESNPKVTGNEGSIPPQQPNTADTTEGEDGHVTSLMNKVTDKKRVEFGLSPAMQSARKEFGVTWDNAMKQIEDGYNPQDLVNSLKKKIRPLNDEENAILLKHQIDKETELRQVNEAINKAAEKGDDSSLAENKIRKARVQDDLQDIYDVGKKAGTENARGLATRQMLANDDYSLAAMVAKKRAANNGAQLSEEQMAAIEKQHKEVQEKLTAYENKIKELEQKVKELQANKKYATKEKAQAVADRLRKLKINKGDKLQANLAAIPTAIWDGAVETVATAIEQGGNLVEAIQKGIDHLQSNGYLKLKDDVETFSNLMYAGVGEERKFVNLLDPEVIKAKASYERAKAIFDADIYKDEQKAKGKLSNLADFFVKWERAGKLSWPTTIAKLASAGLTRLAQSPIEDIIGTGIGAAIPKVRAKAYGEAGFNVKAQAKSFVSAFTQGIKDAGDVMRKGTLGKSDLDFAFGDRKVVLPPEVAEFFGHLHGAIKAPIKRGIFEKSLLKRTTAIIKSGADLTDPLTQSSIALDAYKDANRAIFMQDNILSDAYQKLVQGIENGKDFPTVRKYIASGMQWMIPFVKVPTNIVGETATLSGGGLIFGGAKLLHTVFTKGLDKLSINEADMIMRNLKKGALGSALMLYGYFNPNAFGGFYQPFQKQKEGELKSGQMNLFGVTLPSWLLHAPLFNVMQLGATMRKLQNKYAQDGDKNAEFNGIMAGALGLAKEVPLIDQPIEIAKLFDAKERQYYAGELMKNTIDPGLIQFAAKVERGYNPWTEQTSRKADPKTITEHVETGLPVLTENVPNRTQFGGGSGGGGGAQRRTSKPHKSHAN